MCSLRIPHRPVITIIPNIARNRKHFSRFTINRKGGRKGPNVGIADTNPRPPARVENALTRGANSELVGKVPYIVGRDNRVNTVCALCSV